MRALLRYLYLKHLREGWLVGLIAGPALLLLTPMLIFVAEHAARGTLTFPLAIGSNAASGFDGMGVALAVVVAIGASAAGFYSFAREASNGALGSILLATRTGNVVGSAWAFAVVMSIAGFAVAYIFVSVAALGVTGWSPVMLLSNDSGPIPVHLFAVQLLLICGASAGAGIAMVSIAAVPTMLIPAWAITIGTFLWQYEHFGAVSVALGIVECALLLAAAAWMMRRRCAA
ncbi:MAG: hypothetical protein WA208_01055 [Thermoanaerobaculia bacterium]